jgi:hypothetical protein
LAQAGKAKTGKFTIESANDGKRETVKGEFRVVGDHADMAVNTDADGKHTEMRLIGDSYFLKSPDLPATTKPWAKISLNGDDVLSKFFAAIIKSTTKETDPAVALDQAGKVGTIIRSEDTKLDGRPATHYTIELDLARLVELKQGDLESLALPPELSDLKDQAQQKLPELKQKLEGKHFPVELWLDEQQLPLQYLADPVAAAKALGQPVPKDSKMIVRYTDWGAPVSVDAPPADQVEEFKMPDIRPTR